MTTKLFCRFCNKAVAEREEVQALIDNDPLALPGETIYVWHRECAINARKIRWNDVLNADYYYEVWP